MWRQPSEQLEFHLVWPLIIIAPLVFLIYHREVGLYFYRHLLVGKKQALVCDGASAFFYWRKDQQHILHIYEMVE